jgi:hypothetical protein
MKVKTLRGKTIDMTNIMAKQGNKPAVGNAQMNARGDKIVNGRVVKTRHQSMMEYNQTKSTSVQNVPLHAIPSEVMSISQVAKTHIQSHPAPTRKRRIQDHD